MIVNINKLKNNFFLLVDLLHEYSFGYYYFFFFLSINLVHFKQNFFKIFQKKKKTKQKNTQQFYLKKP